MADIKISALAANGTIDGSELVPIVQSSATKKVAARDLGKIGYQDIQTVSGASKTFAITDLGAWIRFTSASAVAVTIPTNASVAFPIGTCLNGIQAAAGQLTFGGTGVTINFPTGYGLKTRAQGSSWGLVKVATDTWDLVGDLTA